MESAARGKMLMLFLLLPVVLGANPYWKFLKDTLARVHCPDGGSCSDGNTCCPAGGGTYGCCPEPNAVCCSDEKHCCPEGYQCDVDSGTCTKAGTTVEVIKHVKDIEAAMIVICPGNQYSCPDGNTCCPSGESYGCCPFPDANCCSDGVHCCPKGYTCDIAAGKCLKSSLDCDKTTGNCPNEATAKIINSPELMKAREIDVISSCECPSYETCCLNSYGNWGCCPEFDGVCCSDGEHCCPEGYYCGFDQCYKYRLDCDKENGGCVNETVKRIGVVRNDVKNVVCPGGKDLCPDGNTCCTNAVGGYGCCPLPSAVCCSDHAHCCPSGYTCSGSYCQKSSLSGLEDRIPFLKSPASRRL